MKIPKVIRTARKKEIAKFRMAGIRLDMQKDADYMKTKTDSLLIRKQMDLLLDYFVSPVWLKDAFELSPSAFNRWTVVGFPLGRTLELYTATGGRIQPIDMFPHVFKRIDHTPKEIRYIVDRAINPENERVTNAVEKYKIKGESAEETIERLFSLAVNLNFYRSL